MCRDVCIDEWLVNIENLRVCIKVLIKFIYFKNVWCMWVGI